MKHWLPFAKSTRTFCGCRIGVIDVTTDKHKVTCMKCVSLMKLHEHLPD